MSSASPSPPSTGGRPIPTSTTAAPTLTADACSLFSNDAAATALGSPISARTGDKDAGTCSYTAGATSLDVALVPDINKVAFDGLRTSATGALSVDGVGDEAYLTIAPVSIVVLKGSTMLAIGMDHHADAGPDDPNVDGPLLKSLAAQAVLHL
jgi:hypothetical protein